MDRLYILVVYSTVFFLVTYNSLMNIFLRWYENDKKYNRLGQQKPDCSPVT